MGRCRWCAARLGQGRRVWCDRTCRSAYVDAFGTADHAGAVQVVERCAGTCGLDGSTVALGGPVLFPGALAAATRQVAAITHAHPVRVTVGPADGGDNHSLLPSTHWTPAEREMEAV